MKRILCFGDSNTWGFVPAIGTRYDEKTRWTGQLATLLGDDFTVIEEGLNSRTAVFDDPLGIGLNGLTYLIPCLRSHNPIDCLVIMLGTNDTKSRFGATADNIAMGVERLVSVAKSELVWRNQPNILVVAPAIIAPDYATASSIGPSLGDGCHEKSVALVPLLERVATTQDCQFFDANEVVTVSPEDGIHWTSDGHTAFAQQIFEKLKNRSF